MTRDAFDMFQEPERGRFGDNERAERKGPRVTGASDLVDLTLNFAAQTPLAIAVCDPAGNPRKHIWLPKSQIEFEMKGKGVVVVTLPKWLAKSKGLI
jgi:hypothetical protein